MEPVTGIVDHLFRHEAGRLTAVLTRFLGVDRLDTAEDIVQETLVRALERWKYGSLPDNPSAWLMRVARNLALDRLRRESTTQRVTADLIHDAERFAQIGGPSVWFDEHEIRDGMLRMMFSCCHPELTQTAQVALILKVLCGFSVSEIAHALLAGEAAVAKRLTRAKRTLRRSGSLYVVTGEPSIQRRLEAVRRAIYLLFNEGYHSTHAELATRADLCAEAIRLCALLTEHPATATPTTNALAALMCLHAARLEARVSPDGELVQLEAQDRSLWDTQLIGAGLDYLRRSAGGDDVSEYHLEAGIAAQHALAETWDQTDWPAIAELYELLYHLRPSSLVGLNRAIAIAQVDGPRAGLEALAPFTGDPLLEGYPFFHAALGELHRQSGDERSAENSFRAALARARTPVERRFYRARLAMSVSSENASEG